MTLKNFYKNEALDNDVVVSSRIRFARNITGFAFGNRLSDEESEKIVALVKEVFESTPEFHDEYEFINMRDLLTNEAEVFAEQHIISSEFAHSKKPRAIILKKDATISIMINEEDHLRLQVMSPGFELLKTFEIADKLDDLFENRLKYAFYEKLGYLTHCPTNLGTGLRASAMVHLPCLVITGSANKLLSAASKLGIAVRGSYGEGSEAEGCFFQLSNQITMGISEKESIEKLESVVKGIIDAERNARESLMKNATVQLEDRIFRSYGILKYARSINTAEFMQRLSDVRLGISAKFIDNISIPDADYLVISSHPAAIQRTESRILSVEERDEKRASLVRIAFSRN